MEQSDTGNGSSCTRRLQSKVSTRFWILLIFALCIFAWQVFLEFIPRFYPVLFKKLFVSFLTYLLFLILIRAWVLVIFIFFPNLKSVLAEESRSFQGQTRFGTALAAWSIKIPSYSEMFDRLNPGAYYDVGGNPTGAFLSLVVFLFYIPILAVVLLNCIIFLFLSPLWLIHDSQIILAQALYNIARESFESSPTRRWVRDVISQSIIAFLIGFIILSLLF